MMFRISKILILLSFLWTCSACQSDDAPWKSEGETELNVYFRLSVEGVGEQTSRGTWGDQYISEVGSAFDNKIKTNSVQMLVYDQTDNNKYVGLVEDLICYPVSDDGSAYQYFGKLSKKKITAGHAYKFMVIANSATLSPALDGSYAEPDFKIEEVQPAGNHYIPMWGVQKKSILGDAGGNLQSRYDLGEIFLLRAVAKVQVGLSEELMKSYTLVSASVSIFNEKGNVLPKNYKNVDDTRDLTDRAAITPTVDRSAFHPNSSAVGNNYSFQDEVKDVKKLVYLPEYDNQVNEAMISVTVQEKASGKEYTYEDNIRFRNYKTDGSADLTVAPYDIERNFNYQFTVTKVQVANALELICKVTPWGKSEESWDYTEQVSVVKGDEIKWDADTYLSKNDESGYVMMYPGKKLKCTFKISTPTDATWYASFVPVYGKMDAFRFYKQETDEAAASVKEITGKVGEPATLIIGPVEEPVEESNVARLQIVVRTVDGRTIKVKSLSGSSAYEDFSIVQSK